MNHQLKLHLAIAIVISLTSLNSSARADKVLHWKLDEATGPSYLEQVYGTTTQSSEVGTITENLPGLAPDGGTSVGFTRTQQDSYISAGSVEDNAGSPGSYISGAAGTPYKLGNNYSFTSWFNADTITGQDSIIVSSVFNSNSGWMLGVRGDEVIFDFGNTRHTTSFDIVEDKDYFVAVLADPNGDTNFGWSAGANNRIGLYDPDSETWQFEDGTQFKNQLWLDQLSIGRFTNGGRQFDGLVDDVQIYNHTLTFDELDALVNPAAVPEPASVAIWSAIGLGLLGFGFWRRKKRQA